MNQIFTFYKNNLKIEYILMCSIFLFTAVAVMFFGLTIYSRYTKIKNKRLQTKYLPVIEDMLMSILFTDVDYQTVKNVPEIQYLFNNKLLRKLIIDSVINLHQNYEGAYAEKLKNIYFDSGLAKDSFDKLKSKKWEVKCKGIKELAEMNVVEAFDELVELIDLDNQVIAITAINACIKLDGTNGIKHLLNHSHFIDNWTQLNIIDALKGKNIYKTQGIELLLTSKNNSVISLGLKIIQSFGLSTHLLFIQELLTQTQDEIIRNEAAKVVEQFSNSNNLA